jgi:hypothetical protein
MTYKTEDLDRALGIVFDSDAGAELTVREYLHALLRTLWREQEGFSGKRPFGNSDWDCELYAPLIREKYIDGSLDEDGYVNHVEETGAHAFVEALIDRVMLPGEEKP